MLVHFRPIYGSPFTDVALDVRFDRLKTSTSTLPAPENSSEFVAPTVAEKDQQIIIKAITLVLFLFVLVRLDE